ncbi:heavy metal-binding domain-containing protein [Humisphaera borealis]|uniref:Heavy metal binding domain-containing protein n=1 Tax=Humisphaera borealis TaxID=2807512 RepID=A0A7M2X248_9BACT|nr:heavy metal-binding domain-containing protein [Humisphaera borealis]QOV91793.1 hypothetical protein IPV69_10740 [Humisphaera borealis]
MNWQLVPFALLSVLIGGCTAATSSSSSMGPNHPASPAAMETPHAARSTTLASAVLAEATAQPAAHDHGQASAGDNAAHQHAAAPATAPALYTCPMHPEVISTKADDRCPKCGMKLKLKPATQPTASPVAVSEQAGHNHGASAATTQPTSASDSGGHAGHAGAMHACPMHPQVVSADADAKCPKCGMKLKPIPATQSATTAPAAGHDHGGH